MKVIIIFIGCLLLLACVSNSQVDSVRLNDQGFTLEQFDQAVKALTVEEPTRRDPLKVNAMLIPNNLKPGDTVIAVVKINLMQGWHFYSHVPATSSYIETKWHLDLGPGLKVVDDWSGPLAEPYSKDKSDLKVYRGSDQALVFFREMVVEESAINHIQVSTGLYYQVCDPNICLRPRQKSIDLKLNVIN